MDKISEKIKYEFRRPFVAWSNLKQRCYNPQHHSYKYYGKRGIIMSESFKNDFFYFLHYLETLPNYNEWLSNKTLSIDRIDNNLNYEEGNIRFTSKSNQVINTRIYCSNKSGYRGVNYNKFNAKWVACITINKKKIHLGYRKTPEECALLYNNYIIENNLNYSLNKINQCQNL